MIQYELTKEWPDGSYAKRDGSKVVGQDAESLAADVDTAGVFQRQDALDDDTAALVEDSESAVKAALDAQYVTVDSVVEGVVDVTDPAVKALVEDTDSDTRVRLDALYSTEARFAQFDIRDYGAVVDGMVLDDVSMTAESDVLSSTGYAFTADDVGKVIGVSGAGTVSNNYSTNANDGVLIATIESVSSGDAVLSASAVNTVSDATCCFGTPDDTAIAAAQQAAVDAGGGTVFFPPGRTIVTEELAVEDYVSWAGAHRDVSWVEVIKSVTGTGVGDCSWLYCTGRSPSNPLTGATFRDFGIEARYHIRPDGYLTRLKPLNIFYVRRCLVANMHLRNTPATSIPFDVQYDSAIIGNHVYNPGRLFDGSAGGSGIGIGTEATGGSEPGLVIGNTIIGVGDASTEARGHNGIFVEAQSGSTSTASPGYRIIGNHIEGMRIGLADNGSRNTIIANNIVRRCKVGFYSARTISGSFPGRGTIVRGNAFLDCVAPAGGSGTVGVGVYILTTSASGNTVDQLNFVDNVIHTCAGRGMYVLAQTNDMTGVRIRGNVITNTQLTGVWIQSTDSAELINLDFCDNTLINVGAANTASDDTGIRIPGGSTLTAPRICRNRVDAPNGSGFAALASSTITNGRIQDNDFGSGSIAGTVTGTLVSGNTGLTAGESASDIATLLAALETLGIVVDGS